MFEAFQERPVYWDGMPFHRSPTLSRGGDNRDWIQSWQRVAREAKRLGVRIGELIRRIIDNTRDSK